MQVGDNAVHVETFCGEAVRKIRDVTIVRETKTQWVDDIGTRWRKSDRSMVPQYSAGPRYLYTVDRWDAERAKKGGA